MKTQKQIKADLNGILEREYDTAIEGWKFVYLPKSENGHYQFMLIDQAEQPKVRIRCCTNGYIDVKMYLYKTKSEVETYEADNFTNLDEALMFSFDELENDGIYRPLPSIVYSPKQGGEYWLEWLDYRMSANIANLLDPAGELIGGLEMRTNGSWLGWTNEQYGEFDWSADSCNSVAKSLDEHIRSL